MEFQDVKVGHTIRCPGFRRKIAMVLQCLQMGGLVSVGVQSCRNTKSGQIFLPITKIQQH